MKSAPIGIFDSGAGGLSVLSACRLILPHENFVYVYDRSHAPYGDRTPGYVRACARSAYARLLRERCKAVVIACNTATAEAKNYLSRRSGVPVIGVYPPVKLAVRALTYGKTLVLATPVTARKIAEGAFFRTHCKKIILAPQKELASVIEKNLTRRSVIRSYLHRTLDGIKYSGRIENVVAGCTHYALVKNMISGCFGGAKVFDPAEYVARRLMRDLYARGAAAEKGCGSVTFYFT